MRKVDQLLLMIRGIEIIEAKGERKLKQSLNRFCSFVVQQIGRGLHPEERLRIYQMFRDLIMTDALTPQRNDAIRSIMDMNFLVDKTGITISDHIKTWDEQIGANVDIPFDVFITTILQTKYK